jgi:hypothetical protein
VGDFIHSQRRTKIMSLPRGTLQTTDYPLTDPKAKELPAFVLIKVKDILDFRRYVEEDLPDEDSLSYVEVQGCLTSSSIEDITKSVMIKIEDLGYAIHFVYPGGSSAWIRLDNPLSFETIPEHLLPPMSERSSSIWWIVSNTDYALWPRVVKVQIVPQDQITEAFPEIR